MQVIVASTALKAVVEVAERRIERVIVIATEELIVARVTVEVSLPSPPLTMSFPSPP